MNTAQLLGACAVSLENFARILNELVEYGSHLLLHLGRLGEVSEAATPAPGDASLHGADLAHAAHFAALLAAWHENARAALAPYAAALDAEIEQASAEAEAMEGVDAENLPPVDVAPAVRERLVSAALSGSAIAQVPATAIVVPSVIVLTSAETTPDLTSSVPSPLDVPSAITPGERRCSVCNRELAETTPAPFHALGVCPPKSCGEPQRAAVVVFHYAIQHREHLLKASYSSPDARAELRLVERLVRESFRVATGEEWTPGTTIDTPGDES